MIKLINGRGQLGGKLKFLETIQTNEDIKIYHTWNIDDKSEKTQLLEFEKFEKFLSNNKTSKIIFISTLSEAENWYKFYKKKSEDLLLSSTTNSFVVRLPTIIGKGMFQKLKDKEVKPLGSFKLNSIEMAVNLIESVALHSSSVGSDSIAKREYNLNYEVVSAKIVKSLIDFGAK